MTQSDRIPLQFTSLYFKGIFEDVGITKKSKLIEVQRPDLVVKLACGQKPV